MAVMHKYEIAILRALGKGEKLSLKGVMDATGLGKDEVLWALQNLAAGGLAAVRKEEVDEASLSPEGNDCADKGLPESVLARRLAAHGPVQISTLKDEQIGFMWAKKKGLVTIDKGMVKLTEKGREAAGKGMPEEKVLKEIQSDRESYSKHRDTEAVAEFRKRGLLELRSRDAVTEVHLTPKGIKAVSAQGEASARAEASVEARIGDVDSSVIRDRRWKTQKFVAYNIDAPVEPRPVAIRHPLRRTIDDIRNAYLRSGFTEVSGPIIEPAFWVFDYLFMPQDHPARDEQDTFFLSTPKRIGVKDREVVRRIKEEHEKGWHAGWSEEFAMQAMLRTHTTSVTGRHVHQILSALGKGAGGYELPVKLFTMGRVMRNENIDYKHLADFYQSDGIIIGKDLTLANLFDTLLKIYADIGVRIKFVPAYYPFVEPGVTVMIEQEGKWLELGGAGILRREVTGMDRKKISVLAWGLGTERILLIKDKKIDNITALYGSGAGWIRGMTLR